MTSNPPVRVLCVEDDRVNAMLIEQTCLAVGGIEVTVAGTGAEAIELAAQCRPHLLLVDLHLPDGDGHGLLPRLRATAGEPALPAVLCTAEALFDAEPAARAAGFDACWSKPIRREDVIDLLRRLPRPGDAARAAD